MRRKSERNKAKASPEKKVEKPTRKSTRRRGKRSPSTSPERDNSNDAAALSTKQNDGESTATQTRLQGRECEKIDELPENKVSSSETTPKPTPQPQQQQQPQTPPHPQQQQQPDEEDDAGSVWKVARADASPGEIQKLKLCRQRNMSETSDASSSRKRTNKNWQDCGEGVAEEIDSADERSSVPSKTAADSVETTDEIVSAPPGRDSSEEVSDSKEFPPEIATVEMSDDKPNVDDDRQGETIESPICTAVERVDESVTIKTEPSGTLTTTNDGDTCEDQIPNEDATSTVPTIVETSAETIVEMKVETIVETKVEDKGDEGNDKSQEVKEPTATVPTVAEAIPSKEASSDDDDDTKKGIGNKPTRKGSDSSEDNSDVGRKEKTARIPLPRTTSRRKHRDKYRDSSNSDSGESEDDNEREDNRGGKVEKENRETREDTKVVEETKEVKETPKTPETRPETPVGNDTPPVDMVNDSKIENDKPKSEDTSERHDKVVSVAASVVQPQTNSKPAKVNLKRSFSTRISVDTAEPKKDVTDNHAEDIVNQDKENQASIEQVDPKSIPKKRRWGTILSSTDVTPAFSVSTDSLKVLVPGAKPLSINEVRLSKDDDEDRERRNRDKRYTTSEAGGGDLKTREDGEKPKNSEAKKDAKGDNHMASRRKISIVKDTAHTKSPSPPAAVPTSILLIKNLVRPFTLNQIRELLSRTGTIVDNGFWMDRIKSKCFVEYSNEDQAFETRQALHGISWPLSNPKRLQVEYATKDDMALARELSKDQPISRKTEPLAPNDGWQQDWARDERTNSATKVTVVREWDLGKEDGQHFVKDKEREKKEHDKKRRLRSRSPTLEAHLPAPARKFKKKEDDPPPAKLLDDLFRKTKATPCIYWLPLTNEQIVVKEEMRRQHMAEHARRLEEMRRAERNRDGRRRRSPRK